MGKSILFLPKKAPFDMMDNYWSKKSEVKLFVRRVLVAEKFDELLPRYLNFVRGVVDSDDLPLNVSREQLQQNKIMKVFSKKLVRKVLELMKKLAKEGDGDDEDEKDMYKPLTDWWKEKLTDLTEKGAMKDAGVKIEKVELSKRLTESPVVVVTSQFGYSAQQEKVMKAQAFQNKDQLSMMSGRKTLEVNPNHPVVVDLLSKVKADKEDKASLDTAQVLFQTALIESGYEIADPSALVNRVYRLMSKELGVDPDAPLKEVEVPEEEEEADEEDKDESDDSDDKGEEDADESEEVKGS